MVFYYTSENVKMLRNIFMAYNSIENIAPHEYMEFYIEKYADETNTMKLQWIVEIFISINKQMSFLNSISSYFSNELLEEEQDYFMIYFHAIIFHLKTKYNNSLYKSLFNINKKVLQHFVQFLSNNENLNVISQLATENYDATFLAERIIAPLFEWQPYISEMGYNYEEYTKKLNIRNIKPLTVPVGPKLLVRKLQKPSISITNKDSSIVSSVKNTRNNCKMLSKDEIDYRINKKKSENKDKANRLLNEVKEQNFHFAKGKSSKYFKTMQSIQEERDNCLKPSTKIHKKVSSEPVHVAHTVSSIKRLNQHIHNAEQNEVKWLENILQSCRNTIQICMLEENAKKEKEKERVLDVQKKRLLGQISFEEAVLAKKNVEIENQKKYESFLKEREAWHQQIKEWRQSEIEKNKLSVEMLSLQELNLIKAKIDVLMKKKEDADSIKQESDRLRSQIIKERNREMEEKLNMIKEMKILALIAKKSRVPKIVDLTETSGFGLLCEMSMAEVREKLNALKMDLKDKLDTKQKLIKEEIQNNKKVLEDKKVENISYLLEKAELRKLNKERSTAKPKEEEEEVSNEIKKLQNILIEKRKQRLTK